MEKINIKKLSVKFFLAPFLFILGACSSFAMKGEDAACDSYANDGGYYYVPQNKDRIAADTNSYNEIREQGFIKTSENNKSSFSLCSSTGAYTNIKNMVMNYNTLPNKDAVIIEQMLNYFDYSYQTNGDETLSIFNEVSDCPWNPSHKLASIAVKGKEKDTSNKSSNYVFLIDVSGSMSDVMPIVKSSFRILVQNLGDNDRVSIVTYANGVSKVLDGANGIQKDLIISKVDSLMAGGGTNGSGGIQMAYELAAKNFIKDGNNTVILATDGDFNIGISNQKDLENFIAEKRNTGVYLSVLGFGYGNYHSSTAETLANNGNGNAFYIDNERTANKLFGHGLTNAFDVLAKDTKIQVNFDSSLVDSYRLLGYENAMLTEEDFENSQKDAGEVLSGDVTVAMYEIIENDYRDNSVSDSYFTTEIHYKDPSDDSDKVTSNQEAKYSEDKSDDFLFQSLVVEYGLVLRGSEYKGNANYKDIINAYEINANKFQNDTDRDEFYRLVKRTENIS